MRYHIHHRTSYQYAQPVSVSHHSAMMKPMSDQTQTLNSFDIDIDPRPADYLERTDYYGNVIHYFSLQERHETFVVNTHSDVTVYPNFKRADGYTKTADDAVRELRSEWNAGHVQTMEFVFESPCVRFGRLVDEFLDAYFDRSLPLTQAIARLAARINEIFTFDPTATDVSTPVETTLANRRGVCQDFAHVMIACARRVGVPAKYVSGYILTHPPEGEERLVGADASHAWVSIYAPSVGWIEMDPTNSQFCNLEHVRVATGRDFRDVSMLKGALTGGHNHSLRIAVTMTPLTSATPARYALDWSADQL